MAENQDGQEKSEQPTGKRLGDARKKGQVPRSRELNTVALTLVGAVALVMMSRFLGAGLWGIMRANFSIPRADLFEPLAVIRHLAQAMRDAAYLLAPFFALMVVVSIAASIALGGFSVSMEALKPNFKKFNPVEGLKRLISPKSVLELGKALGKFLLVAGVAVWLLRGRIEEILALSYLDLGVAVGVLHDLVGWSFVMIAATLLLIAALDVPFQLWEYKRQLKMTKQEVKDERKQTDANPEVRARIRGLQREMAFRRMMQEVPQADVIVTNPTHYAVALRYDQQRMRAPKLVAKGVDLVAQNIRRVGGESGVPVVEAPILARALYHSTEIGSMIPAGLYLAVAKLLAYVFQLKACQIEGGEKPEVPEFPIPEDLRAR